MNPTILSQFGIPDPNAAPLNFTEEVALLNTLITSELQGDYIPYIISSDTPSVDDQDKAWIELDGSSRPLAIKTFYNGNWRRVYNGMVGEVRMYSGDPSIDFDTNGLGIVGGKFDGWHIMNGMDGTMNLTDKFIIGAHMDNSGGHVGYNSGWQTFVNGTSDLGTGGTNNFTLTEATTYRPPYPNPVNTALQLMDHYHSGGGGDTSDPAGSLWGVNSTQHLQVVPQDPGNILPTPVPILPPFLALAFITFVGYS